MKPQDCKKAYALLLKTRDQFCKSCEHTTLEVPDGTDCAECGGETVPSETIESDNSIYEKENRNA